MFPHVAADYNARMNVIDEANRWAAMYTPWRRAKRWWFSIILGFIHISVTNAWVLYRATVPAEEQTYRSFALWTDALAVALITIKPLRKVSRPAVARHSYAQERGAKGPIRGRCSVCCHRTVEHDHAKRIEAQSGRKSSWFCVDCSARIFSKIYVCDDQDCRIAHAVAPNEAPVLLLA